MNGWTFQVDRSMAAQTRRRWMGSSVSLVAAFAAAGVWAQGLHVPPRVEDLAGLRRVVVDRIIGADALGRGSMGNWEPSASVLGSQVFLIQANAYTEERPGGEPHPYQRFRLAFQRVEGGDTVEGECFFSDDGLPYPFAINHYRQNGNPGRVAGDKRPGAVHLIAGGETSIHEVDGFQPWTRWSGLRRRGRFATVQTYALDGDSLQQQPTAWAFDPVHGRVQGGDVTSVGVEISRFGGDLAALDNGNFVVVVDDRSMLHAPARAATAVIVGPDGSIVRETFVIGLGELWSNVCAFRGGFCVRLSGMLRFYDNTGNFLGEVDQDQATLRSPDGAELLFAFDRGRGDGTRIQSHIRSRFVFLSGRSRAGAGNVRLAAWDARTRAYVGGAWVNEIADPADPAALEFRADFDRVNLAVDALDRIAVAYEAVMPGTTFPQVVTRVLAFDAARGSFRPLTPSFFAFVNASAAAIDGSGVTVRSFRPSVAMTTREICVAAKGEVNLGNDPGAGPDSPIESNFFTVFGHPDPRPDPTLPVGAAPDFVGPFLRSDCNGDGIATGVTDAVTLLMANFLGGIAIPCRAACDANSDGNTGSVTDAVTMLTVSFVGRIVIAAPFPTCGVSSAATDLELGCLKGLANCR